VVEPCADYRNQICIQSKEFGVNGTTVEFDNAACIANNWRACIDLNSDDDDAMKDCSEAVNCMVENVAIADKFTFDVCLPRYPGGFSLNDERYQTSAETLCGMATQTCTVVRVAKTWGGCKYAANEDCLTTKFTEEMNDFCRGLGDCGGSANVVGEYSENYVMRRDGVLTRVMFLSQSWINGLKDLAVPVLGQFAEVEDYSEYLEAAGVWGVPSTPGAVEEEESFNWNSVGSGISGISTAMSFAAGGSEFLGIGGFLPGAATTLTTTSVAGAGGGMAVTTTGAVPASGMAASVSAFAGAAMGAGIGMIAGAMLANYLGLSPGGSMLMSIGGAMVGAYVMIANNFMGAAGSSALLAAAPFLLWIGIALIVLSLFFGGDDCPAIEVEFECQPWQPVSGGDDCEKCNGDPLKPCSEYRCESLGAGCELINEGSDDELCVSGNPNDVTPPVIVRNVGVGFDGGDYEDVDGGFSVVGSDGGCLAAYTPLSFGIVTSEPAQCRFDVEMKDFEDMSYDLGGNSYLYNHAAVFSLPDPSHGESQGANWSGELNLYIKCSDRYGLISNGFYEVGMCVVEGDDVTAPVIVASEPASGGVVGFDVTSVDVLIVTNEFAECRWDLDDVGYSDMGNSLECNDSFESPSNVLGYSCSSTLPLVSSEYVSSEFYVRCMDQPWLSSGCGGVGVSGCGEDRNANQESFVLSLTKPDSKISIDKIMPDSDFEVSTDSTTIELKVATSGGGASHFCSYSFSGYDKMIEMFETGDERTHVQVLNLGDGAKKIYVECRDETGDFAKSSTEFEIVQDSSSPIIARIWQAGNSLHFITTENAECRYSMASCKFGWESGENAGSEKKHSVGVVKGEVYHIRCKDDFGNVPSGCSIEVVAL